MSDCTSALDWLRKFDGKWLEENLPKPKRARDNGRGIRKNGHKADLDCVALVQAAMRAELGTKVRPAL